MHNKYNGFESPQNHPHPKSMEKLSPTKLDHDTKKVGDCCSTSVHEQEIKVYCSKSVECWPICYSS